MKLLKYFLNFCAINIFIFLNSQVQQKEQKKESIDWYKQNIENKTPGDKQKIAHFIQLVIQRCKNPSDKLCLPLNSAISNCANIENNDAICAPIFKMSQDQDVVGLTAYYSEVFTELAKQNPEMLNYDGQTLPNPTMV